MEIEKKRAQELGDGWRREKKMRYTVLTSKSSRTIFLNDAALNLSENGNTPPISLCGSGRNWPCLGS